MADMGEPEDHGRLDPPDEWASGEPASTLEALAPALGRAQVVDPLFEAVMDAASSGFFIMNARRKILYANYAMSELTGYSVEELLALPSGRVLTPPEDELTVRELVAEAFRVRRRRVVRHRELIHKNGHRVPVSASAEALVIDGHVRALVVEFTDRSDAEAALAASREQAGAVEAGSAELATFREIVSRASDAILIFQDGQIVSRNDAFRDRLGFGGERTDLTDILEADSLPRALEAIRRMESGQTASETVTVALRDAEGELLTLEATLSPITFRGTPAVLAVARDVTERLAIDQRLRASERLELLTRISAGAAHELADALASLTPAVGDDAPRELRNVVDEARRLASSLALIGGQGVGRPESLAVEPLLRGVVAGRSAQQRARVHLECAPGQHVYGRRDDLALACESLLLNALEAGPGPVHVQTEFVLGLPDEAQTEDDALQGFALIEIRDSGVGMGAAEIARMGEPFSSTKQGHVGLGTAMAFAVVRARSGRTTVESTIGGGTTVRIYLPLVAAAATAEGITRPLAPSSGSRLLLVDDNRTLRMVTATALRGAGYDVVEAGAVSEARDLLARVPRFDVLVLDIRLDDGTGLELFRAAGGEAGGPPTLFVSGYSGDELAELAPSAGWHFMAKPYSRQGLLEAIDQLLVGAGARA